MQVGPGALEVADDLARHGGSVTAFGVSFMERVVRSNSRALISPSMRRIDSLSEGWKFRAVAPPR